MVRPGTTVLEDALHCYQKYVDSEDPRHRQLFAEAEEWIDADEPTWFFSFQNVCHTLDLRRQTRDAHAQDEQAAQRDGLHMRNLLRDACPRPGESGVGGAYGAAEPAARQIRHAQMRCLPGPYRAGIGLRDVDVSAERTRLRDAE